MKHLTVHVDGGVPYVAEIRSCPELDLAIVTLLWEYRAQDLALNPQLPTNGGTNSKSSPSSCNVVHSPFRCGSPSSLITNP